MSVSGLARHGLYYSPSLALTSDQGLVEQVVEDSPMSCVQVDYTRNTREPIVGGFLVGQTV